MVKSMEDKVHNIMEFNKKRPEIEKANPENTHVKGSIIEHSGNSEANVHVNIQIDTMPIAFAILCSSLASNQISKEEFNSAYHQLLNMNADYMSQKNAGDPSHVKLIDQQVWEK
jgi:hypothetical protein